MNHDCIYTPELIEAADAIERGYAEGNELAKALEQALLDMAEARKELGVQSAENERYKQWFKENGTNLANHKIGGFEFGEFVSTELSAFDLAKNKVDGELTGVKEAFDAASTEQTPVCPNTAIEQDNQERCRHIGNTWTAGGQTYCDDCGIEVL